MSYFKLLTMNRPGILIALLAVTLFSCSRSMDGTSTISGSLEGTWRMVIVKDNATSLQYNKPGAITGDVEITIVVVNPGKGFINGKTPTNTLYGDYTTEPIDKISIPCVAYTKVAETSWGLDFLQNINTADTYSFEEGGRLRIHTNKKTLIFKRN